MDGQTFWLYPNPEVEKDPGCTGPLLSHLLLALPGIPYALYVKFDRAFKLFSADSIGIHIINWQDSTELRLDDNNQCFYPDKSEVNVYQTFCFRLFGVWDRNGDLKWVLMRMPNASR